MYETMKCNLFSNLNLVFQVDFRIQNISIVDYKIYIYIYLFIYVHLYIYRDECCHLFK